MGKDVKVVIKRAATGDRLICYANGVRDRCEIVDDRFLHRCMGCESLNTRLLYAELVYRSPECWEIMVRCEDCGRERHEVCKKAAMLALEEANEHAQREVERLEFRRWAEGFYRALRGNHIHPVDF